MTRLLAILSACYCLTATSTHAAEPPGKGRPMHAQKPVDLQAARRDATTRATAWKTAGKPLELLAVEPYGAGSVEHWRLGNGMQVLLAPDPQVPVVAIHSWLDVGSADEVVGKTGLAHLFEHLMFKSTKSRPAGTLDRVLEQLGGSANAATSLDFTYYHTTVPAANVGTVLAMEADRLTQLDLTVAAFRSELSVVRNERREVVDNDPDGQIDELLSHLLWGTHPYGHPVVGTEADLGGLKVDDARQFYRAHYAPARLVLVVAGGLDPEKVLAEVLEHYAALPGGDPARHPQPVAVSGGVERTTAVDASTERLALAWRLPGGDHADLPALDLLAQLLAGGDAARLTRALVFDKPVASSVTADLSAGRLGGSIQVHVTLLPGERARTALQRVDQVLGAWVPTDAELLAAKNRLKMELYGSLTSVDGRAEQLGQAMVCFGSLRSVLQAQADTDAVTLADVQRVARKYLKPDSRVVILGEAPPPKVSGRASKRQVRG